MGIEERRRFVRVPECLEISYRILHAKDIETFITKDISAVGIKFLAHNVLPKDSLLEIRLNFPKTHFSFETMVKVVWVRKEIYSENRYEVGAEFINLPKEATEYIISYIKFLKGDKAKKEF